MTHNIVVLEKIYIFVRSKSFRAKLFCLKKIDKLIIIFGLVGGRFLFFLKKIDGLDGERIYTKIVATEKI
jgi:hypothetical protein